MEFLKKFRTLRKHLELKAKLSFDEKKFVENNKFHKLAVSDPSSSENDPKTVEKGDITPQKKYQSSKDINHLDTTA